MTKQGCIKFIVWKENQVVKKEKFMAVGKNITRKKRKRESNIIFPLIFRLLGRIEYKRGLGKNIKL